MLIAHVTFRVSEENRQLAFDTLKDEIARVRTMEGCVAFVPFLPPNTTEDVCVLHEWQTGTNFDAYTASDSFRAIGGILRPLMVAPPVSKRFDATLIDNVN